jgi:6,7-dimethyl-8-ribityllumazine synthase
MTQYGLHNLAPRFAFIQTRWHADIVEQCRKGFTEEIARATDNQAVVDVFKVPGAFEIPLTAKRLSRLGVYDAIVGSAFVVNGGIYRHEFVASTVVSALMDVQLETDTPILSAVLTPHNFHETDEHREFFRRHFVIKGKEAAEACVGVIKLTATIGSLASQLRTAAPAAS